MYLLCVCISLLGYIDTHSALLHTPQVYEYVYRTMQKYCFLLLMCFLWLPSLPHFFFFFIGANVGPNVCSGLSLPKYRYES
jgi:hypothetical protein